MARSLLPSPRKNAMPKLSVREELLEPRGHLAAYIFLNDRPEKGTSETAPDSENGPAFLMDHVEHTNC